jgi:hypothetical protein
MIVVRLKMSSHKVIVRLLFVRNCLRHFANVAVYCSLLRDTSGRNFPAAPGNATKATHTHVRELYKSCALAVQYCMEEVSLAKRIGQSRLDARELLRKHRQTYKVFWRWSDAALDHALLLEYLHTVLGWTIHVGPETNPHMLRNFLMQGNGAEILRLACCFATERGIGVGTPIDDALLIEAPLDRLESDVARTQLAMAEASGTVLNGFELRAEAKALIFFIQDIGEQHFGVAALTWIALDGAWVGANKNNSYFSVSVQPGEHHMCSILRSEWLGHPVEFAHFTAEAGKVYYFRARYTAGFLFIEAVDNDEARYLIDTYPQSVSQPKK